MDSGAEINISITKSGTETTTGRKKAPVIFGAGGTAAKSTSKDNPLHAYDQEMRKLTNAGTMRYGRSGGRNVQTLDVSEDDTNLMSLVQTKSNRHGGKNAEATNS